VSPGVFHREYIRETEIEKTLEEPAAVDAAPTVEHDERDERRGADSTVDVPAADYGIGKTLVSS
jgi:hypothetical protein